MNRKTRLTATLVTAGVVGLGALALAAPAIAGAGPFGHPAAVATGPAGSGNGMGPGYGTRDGMKPGNGMGPANRIGNGAGMGPGAGMGNGAGMGPGAGLCPLGTDVASGTLTEAQKSTLAAMAEEEKLAGDLYQVFADKYPAVIFDRIAAAEDQHLTAVRTLLTRYGVADPTAGKATGQFATAAVQASYDRLLAQGLTGENVALDVGRQVETADIADLQRALDGLTAGDVQRVYQHLLAASRQHLSAFTNWSAR